MGTRAWSWWCLTLFAINKMVMTGICIMMWEQLLADTQVEVINIINILSGAFSWP